MQRRLPVRRDSIKLESKAALTQLTAASGSDGAQGAQIFPVNRDKFKEFAQREANGDSAAPSSSDGGPKRSHWCVLGWAACGQQWASSLLCCGARVSNCHSTWQLLYGQRAQQARADLTRQPAADAGPGGVTQLTHPCSPRREHRGVAMVQIIAQPDHLTSLEQELLAEGFEAARAATIREASDATCAVPYYPDVVLLDGGLGGPADRNMQARSSRPSAAPKHRTCRCARAARLESESV